MFRCSPEREAEIRTLSGLLREIPLGEVLSYDTMTEAIGRDVRGDARVSLLSARQTVEREPEGRRFETLRGVGIKRIETADIPGIGAASRRKINRTARQGHARLCGITANDLTPEIQKKIDFERSVLGAIALASSSRTAVKVEKATPGTSGEIPAAVILALMTK